MPLTLERETIVIGDNPLPTPFEVGGKLVINKVAPVIPPALLPPQKAVTYTPLIPPDAVKLTLELVEQYLDSVGPDENCGTIGSTRDCVLARAARFGGARNVEVGYHGWSQVTDHGRYFEVNQSWQKHIIEGFDMLTSPTVANVRPLLRGR